MAEKVTYELTLETMSEWINKERITKKNLKNLSQVLQNSVRELL